MLSSHSCGPVTPGAGSTLSTADEDRESAVSQFFHDFRDRDRGAVKYFLRQPLRTLRTLRDLLRLPLLRADLDVDDVEGAPIHRALAQRHTMRRFLPHAAVLVLPSEPGGYLVGPRRQTVRRMIRKAERAGVRCTSVDDLDGRSALLRIADTYERTNPRHSYRNPDALNEDLPDARTWLVARVGDYRPLVLSVTPVQGEWALLRYFRTLGPDAECTHARYALIAHLAECLGRSGVRYLFDEAPPARLPNGLRHYQRMVGFRLYRTHPTSSVT